MKSSYFWTLNNNSQVARLSDQAVETSVVLVSHPGILHNILLSMLESLPCVKVLEAAGALSAYGLLQEVPVDSVIIDTSLPHLEKVALLRRIKQEFPAIRCIGLTTTAKNHPALREAGADVLMLQNCSRQELEAVVCGSEAEGM